MLLLAFCQCRTHGAALCFKMRVLTALVLCRAKQAEVASQRAAVQADEMARLEAVRQAEEAAEARDAAAKMARKESDRQYWYTLINTADTAIHSRTWKTSTHH